MKTKRGCETCGQEFISMGRHHRFCKECIKVRKRQQQKVYNKEHWSVNAERFRIAAYTNYLKKRGFKVEKPEE
jgi:protein-arginine kinase activator protein McsA